MPLRGPFQAWPPGYPPVLTQRARPFPQAATPQVVWLFSTNCPSHSSPVVVQRGGKIHERPTSSNRVEIIGSLTGEHLKEVKRTTSLPLNGEPDPASRLATRRDFHAKCVRIQAAPDLPTRVAMRFFRVDQLSITTYGFVRAWSRFLNHQFSFWPSSRASLYSGLSKGNALTPDFGGAPMRGHGKRTCCWKRKLW